MISFRPIGSRPEYESPCPEPQSHSRCFIAQGSTEVYRRMWHTRELTIPALTHAETRKLAFLSHWLALQLNINLRWLCSLPLLISQRKSPPFEVIWHSLEPKLQNWYFVVQPTMSLRCRFETVEVSSPEWIEVVGIDSVFLDPLRPDGCSDRFGVCDPFVSYEPSWPLKWISTSYAWWVAIQGDCWR